MSVKNAVTPPGIDPGSVRLVAQSLRDGFSLYNSGYDQMMAYVKNVYESSGFIKSKTCLH